MSSAFIVLLTPWLGRRPISSICGMEQKVFSPKSHSKLEHDLFVGAQLVLSLNRSPQTPNDLSITDLEDFAPLFPGAQFFSPQDPDSVSHSAGYLTLSGDSKPMRYAAFAYMNFCKQKTKLYSEYLNNCYRYLRQDISAAPLPDVVFACSLLS